VKYRLKDGVEIPSEWLYEHVIPSIRARFGNDSRLCHLMALTLLFACLRDDVLVPNRVRTAYNELGLDVQQPVETVGICVYCQGEQLEISELVTVEGENGNGNPIQIHGGTQVQELFQSLQAQINELRQLITNYTARSDANVADQRSYMSQKFRILNNNIRATIFEPLVVRVPFAYKKETQAAGFG